jgi:hypothetical protein
MTDPLSALAALVCKRGVGVGGLTQAQRLLALAVPARALPRDSDHTEAQANAALIAALGAEAVFLDTDHVELRRWLVDTGWWWRDGYGRVYRRPVGAALPQDLQPIDAALDGLADLRAWVADCAARHEALRAARRAAWAAVTPGGAGHA